MPIRRHNRKRTIRYSKICKKNNRLSNDSWFIFPFIYHQTKYQLFYVVAPSLEGVFRISATKTSLSEAIKKIDSGENIDFDDLPDSHIVPGLLKSYLRELPEPLLTFQLYGQFLRANCKHLFKLTNQILSKP